MSLIKQLWIGTILLLLLALGGSFFINLLSAKEYLENQLKIKNIDDANSLALSLSQMKKDKIDIELIITAQFDAGHYEYIMFNDQHKKPIAVRQFDETNSTVPKWFSHWIHFDVAPGVALIQDGWQQYGSILVKSHSEYAIESLWKEAKQLFEWFIVITLLACLLGIFAFRRISTPLHRLVDQAEAISKRRFATYPEPKTFEFRRLAKAMNQLSNDVKVMMEKEAIKLDLVRRDALLDPLTGLCNRQHFFNLLDAMLTNENSDSQGVILVGRVLKLNELNALYGRDQVDEILTEVAQVFHYLLQQFPNSHAGRLNGSDFAVAIPSIEPIDVIAAEFVQRINFQLIAHDHQSIAIPIAATSYNNQDDRTILLHNLDGALAQAEMKGDHAIVLCTHTEQNFPHRNLTTWKIDLENAIKNNHFKLGQYSVRNFKDEEILVECPLRLLTENQEKPAGYFIPWASRLNLMTTIDLLVTRLAIQNLNHIDLPLEIYLSASLLNDSPTQTKLLCMLKENKAQSNRLWITFSEVAFIRFPDEFRVLVTELNEIGCKLGLAHVGLEFTRFEQLQDLGIHFLKLDSAIIRQIDNNENNQSFVQGLCKLGHSLGLLMIAEGVTTEMEKTTLIKLDVDALTGPLIT